MIIDKILEQYPEIEFIRYDDLDAAVVGVDMRDMRLIYEEQMILADLEARGMSDEEAIEFYNYNILGLTIEDGPIIVDLNWE